MHNFFSLLLVFLRFSISQTIFIQQLQFFTNPIQFLSIFSDRYLFSLSKNLNSRNLNKGDSIAIGLNCSYLGIYGQTLFNGTKSTLKVDGIQLRVSLFHRFINKSFLMVVLIHQSTIPSAPMAFPFELISYNLFIYSQLSGLSDGNSLNFNS